MPTRVTRLPLVLALAIVAGCAAPRPNTPETRITGGEGRVAADAYGNINISIAGRNYRVKTADLKPIGDLTIQAGARFYTLRDGKFYLPEGAMRDIKADDKAYLRIFVPGYLPKQVWLGAPEDEIVVAPIALKAVALAIPPSGGTLRADDGTVEVAIGGGMLTKDGTKVALSTYAPELTPKSQDAFAADRSGFLSKIKARGGQAYALAQACEAPDDPLPCPPLTESTGIMLTVDGPLRPGKLTATLDLDKMMGGWNGTGNPPGGMSNAAAAQARAAAKLKRTLERIQRHPRSADYLAVLAQDYGVRFQDGKLLFDVNVGIDDSIDGMIRTDVEGVSLLGVGLEFTAISSLNGALPTVALPPGVGVMGDGTSPAAGTPLAPPINAGNLGINAGHLIGMDGSTLVAAGGGNLIGMDGSTLIGMDGSTLVAAGGGNLIGLDGSTLIGLDGGSLIGLGAGLIGLDGSTLIGNDGSTLVDNSGGMLAGHAELPFPEQPKYRLNAYQEVVYPNQGQARLETYEGVPLSEWVPIDGDGNFYVYKLPKSPLHFKAVVEIGSYKMAANAIAPKDKLTGVRVNAASTVVAAVIEDRRPTLFDIALSLLSLGGYNDDVKQVRAKLTQQQAQDAVINGQPGALAVATAIDPLGDLITGICGLLPAPPMLPGKVETYAGTGAGGSLDGKRITADTFERPVAIDARGNAVYMLDDERLRETNPGNTRTTLGPLGVPPADFGGFSFDTPTQYTDLQASGNDMLVSDFRNQAIFRIEPNRTVTTICHSSAGIQGFHYMADGTIYAVLPGYDKLVKYVGGVETTVYGSPGDHAKLDYPQEVVAVDNDTLLIVDAGNDRIVGYKISTGYAGVVLSIPTIQDPSDLAVGKDGWIYVSDTSTQEIRRIKLDPDTLAATANELVAGGGWGYVDGPAGTAKFHDPVSIAWKGEHLFIADKGNKRIRRLKPNP